MFLVIDWVWELTPHFSVIFTEREKNIEFRPVRKAYYYDVTLPGLIVYLAELSSNDIGHICFH